MIRFLLIMMCSVTLSFAQKIVVDLTTGDMETFMTRFMNGVPGTADYFASRGESVEVVVVVHGEAYRYFIENLENTQYGVDEKLAARQESIRKRLNELQTRYKMRFEICQAGMHRKGILSEDLYPFVTPIPSAMIGLVKWQNEGFAYIPIP